MSSGLLSAGPMLAVTLGALIPGVLALAVPQVITRLPEPVLDPDDPPKEPWPDFAARPGLARRCAVCAAVVGALVGWWLGWSWLLLPWLALVPAGVALAVIDWKTRLLPTRLVWLTYAVVAVLVVISALAGGDPGSLLRAGIASLAAFAFFYVLWWLSPRSLGFGDVRLSAVLGLALGQLGVGAVLLGVWSGFLLGGVIGAAMRLSGRLARGQHIAFGPFMLLGALVGVWLGERIWASRLG